MSDRASTSRRQAATTPTTRSNTIASAKKRNTHTTATTSSVRKYIITKTGRYYHLDAHCYYLRLAKELIPTKTPPNHAAPCPRCVPIDKQKPTKTTTHSSPHRKPGSLSYNQLSGNPQYPKPAKYVVTTTGKFYHLTEACPYLRFVKRKLVVSTVPSHLGPCPRCAAAADPAPAARGLEAWRPGDNVVDASPDGPARPPKGTTDVTTRTGKDVHGEEDCFDLRKGMEKLTVTSVPEFPVPARATSPNSKDGASARNEPHVSSAVSDGMAALLNQYGTKFYETRIGKNKFHVDKACRHLQGRETFKCDPTTAGKDPCRTCALDLFQEWELAGFTKRK